MLPQITAADMMNILPLLALVGLAGLALVLEVVFKESGRIACGLVMVAGVAAIAAMVVGRLADPVTEAFAGSLLFDGYTLYLTLIFLLATTFGLLFEISDPDVRCGEVYGLTLLAACGMVVMTAGLDLMTVLLGLEVMSLSVYALAGVRRTDLLSNEASLKYFLLGAFASAFFVYGMVLCYGATGSIYLESLASFVADRGSVPPLLLTGMALILVGLAFKVALVPFHMWTPDVYEGAPTGITAFMSTGVKAAGFAAFFRVLLTAFPDSHLFWHTILWWMAVATMTVGNFIALSQKSVKRMLAYSSIAHAGYILLALVAAGAGHEAEATSAALFYLLSYTFMTAGAFGVILLLDLTSDGDDERRFSGLGWNQPVVGICMSIFLLSLAGIPPMAGFIAKFYVFSAVLQTGSYSLVIVAVLNSLVSLYYYLRPLVWMYMGKESREGSQWRSAYTASPLLYLALLLAVVGTLSLGLWPARKSAAAFQAAKTLTPVQSVSTVLK